MDPILNDETDDRFVLFPIKSEAIWLLYKKHVDSFWRAEEIDLSKDANDWLSLSDDERYFLLHILAFFAGSDGIVSENLAMRFYNDVKLPEARCFYGFQIAMENIHSETYSILIDTFAGKEKQKLFKGNSELPCDCKKSPVGKEIYRIQSTFSNPIDCLLRRRRTILFRIFLRYLLVEKTRIDEWTYTE